MESSNQEVDWRRCLRAAECGPAYTERARTNNVHRETDIHSDTPLRTTERRKPAPDKIGKKVISSKDRQPLRYNKELAGIAWYGHARILPAQTKTQNSWIYADLGKTSRSADIVVMKKIPSLCQSLLHERTGCPESCLLSTGQVLWLKRHQRICSVR